MRCHVTSVDKLIIALFVTDVNDVVIQNILLISPAKLARIIVTGKYCR